MTMPYKVTILENDRILTEDEIPDPFHRTEIKVRGWRNALKVLFHRYGLTVRVGADHDRMEQVLELNPDYLGPAGSRSRTAWDAQLGGALHRFAEGLPE